MKIYLYLLTRITAKDSLVRFKLFTCRLSFFLSRSNPDRPQDAASRASASRPGYLSEVGLIPSSREVAVEEFANYHRHQIGSPKAGEAVAMDVRWGND